MESKTSSTFSQVKSKGPSPSSSVAVVVPVDAADAPDVSSKGETIGSVLKKVTRLESLPGGVKASEPIVHKKRKVARRADCRRRAMVKSNAADGGGMSGNDVVGPLHTTRQADPVTVG